MNEIYDLVIVGAGPGGLTAATYGGRAKLKTLVVEKSSFGGRITQSAEIKNFPGTILDSGEHLMSKFKEQAQSYESVTLKRTTVTDIKKNNENFIVSTKRRGDFEAKAIILDLGIVPSGLGVPGEKEFVGYGVSYCATCDAEFFKDQEIFVIGSGNQAIAESGHLSKFAAKVNIIVSNDEGILDVSEAAAKQIKSNPKVNFIWNSTLTSIEGSDKVESVTIKNNKTGDLSHHSTKGVFFFIGMKPETELVKDLVERDSHGYIQVNNKQETNVPGIYAIGDCTNSYLKQVITSCGDGARAAFTAQNLISAKSNS